MPVGERVVAALTAIMGLFAVLENRAFARAGVTAGRDYFGRPLREGSREYRFNWMFSRVTAVSVGTLLFVSGVLGAAGIDWRDIYR